VWIFPWDRDSGAKAARVLDLCARVRDGEPLGSDDYVISGDENPAPSSNAEAIVREAGKETGTQQSKASSYQTTYLVVMAISMLIALASVVAVIVVHH
jgi:hypothetical protein